VTSPRSDEAFEVFAAAEGPSKVFDTFSGLLGPFEGTSKVFLQTRFLGGAFPGSSKVFDTFLPPESTPIRRPRA